MEYPFKKEKSETLPPLLFNEKIELKLIDEVEVIPCLKCEKSYEFPKCEDDYLAHLFLEHRLVIADVSDIADLKDYLKYWTQRFKKNEFEEYCTTMLLDQLPDGSPAKNEKYYLLSDILPQDYDIRKQLREQRLKQTLARHQFERSDREFQKECLYCRDVIKGLRAAYVEHLFNKHFLQLGKPENLVYVDELIAKVQLNLEQLICLYCEKVFKDRVALKDHMRKKGHKRINPNNPNYDKYFLINYRTEKPKAVKSINKQVQEKTTRQKSESRKKGLTNESIFTQLEHPKLENEKSNNKGTKEDSSVDFNKYSTNSDESDSDWSDWDCEEQPSLNCLYCTHKEPDFILLKSHMLQEHQMDFDSCVRGLNFYQKVKIINYIRRQICFQRCVICNNRYDYIEALLEHMSSEKHFGIGTQKQWDRPEYFFPTYDDDGLLCVLDDNPTDNMDDTVVRIISEQSSAQINKDAERLSLENFQFL